MTTPANNDQTAAQGSQQNQQAPIVDVEAITKKATEAAQKAALEIADKRATEIAADRLKEIGRAMTGEAAPDPKKRALVDFAEDPTRTLLAVKEIAKRETKQELQEELRREKEIEKVQLEVGGKFIQEYPELNSPKKMALVERLADDYVSQGLSYKDALEKSMKEAVDEFKLKPVSEAERFNSYARTGLPGGGGYTPGAPKFDESKSQSDFITGLRNRHSSVVKQNVKK